MERSLILILSIFFITLSSNIGSVKADLTDTFASIILFIIFTSFVFAGIGWWSKRQEKQ